MFRKYGVLIGNGSSIGKNVKFVHPTGIVIGDKVKIGKNVLIYQNVTIGKANNSKSKKDGYPVIEDNVIIYANSVIAGPVKIGKGSIIGANSFVNKDVEPGDIVAGNPAKKLIIDK